MTDFYPQRRDIYVDEETGEVMEYDPHTGESSVLDDETALEWSSLKGACPYCGDHHGETRPCFE